MKIIDDLTARKLASEWHSGGGSPLYALASSGAIVAGIFKELNNTLYCQSETICQNEIEQLIEYVNEKGYRGQQEGWSKLTW